MTERSATGGLAPGVFGLVGGVERQFDIGGGRARDLAKLGAGDRAQVVEVAALHRLDELAADEIAVTGANEMLFGDFIQRLLEHDVSSLM